VNIRAPSDALPLNAKERQFYIVMHHLATVLWVKGLAVEALRTLSGVLEAANGQERVRQAVKPEAVEAAGQVPGRRHE
jgi:hypothetical protein